MKPAGAVLHRDDYRVETVPLDMARALVAAEHYAGGSSNTAVYRHGLFTAGDPLTCVGAALWLPPTKPAAVSVATDWRGVLCLTRLVVAPGVPTNAASFLLGKSIGLIRREGRFHTLLTYADEGQGHTGAIYRATNWDYLGAMPGHELWLDAEGRQVAVKSTVNRTFAQMEALGHRRGGKSRKHKFVMRLNTRSAGSQSQVDGAVDPE